MSHRLDARPLELPFDGRHPTTALERSFWAFHAANPQVYARLRALALEARAAGVLTIGIAALFERLRWASQVETAGDPYKLNNNYRAFYARLLMAQEPTLRGLFRCRPSVGDDVTEPAA